MTGRGKRSVAEEALTAGTWGGDVHMQFSVKTGTVDVVMAQSGEKEWHCLSSLLWTPFSSRPERSAAEQQGQLHRREA